MRIIAKILLIFSIFTTNAYCYEVQKFVCLKGKDANIRNGLGEEYKILWTYHKTTMPLEVLHRVDNWYMIRDHMDQIGWIKTNLVTDNKKMRKIITKAPSNLCRFPVNQDTNCIKIASLNRGVIASLLACNKTWCRIRISSQMLSGWLPKSVIWGVKENEIL